MRIFVKRNIERKKNISSQACEIAERYGFGRPLAEYHMVFLRREVVRIIRCLFAWVLFVVAIASLIRSLFDPSNGRDAREILFALCIVALFAFWIVDLFGLFRRFQDLSQQRTSLLVCHEGFLYFYNGHVEIVPWQQIQRYTFIHPGISRQITIYRTDGRQFQIDDRLHNFGNFLWRLTSLLMTRDQKREDTFFPLPKVFRFNSTPGNKNFYLLLGGVAVVEGIVWTLYLNDPPLLAQTFGFLQFLLGWVIFVVLVMFFAASTAGAKASDGSFSGGHCL